MLRRHRSAPESCRTGFPGLSRDRLVLVHESALERFLRQVERHARLVDEFVRLCVRERERRCANNRIAGGTQAQTPSRHMVAINSACPDLSRRSVPAAPCPSPVRTRPLDPPCVPHQPADARRASAHLACRYGPMSSRMRSTRFSRCRIFRLAIATAQAPDGPNTCSRGQTHRLCPPARQRHDH